MTATLVEIVDALDGRKEGNGYRCRCPVHGGKSLIVTDRDGKILFHCKQGCEQVEVIAALRERGLWPAGGADNGRTGPSRHRPRPKSPMPSSTPDDIFTYPTVDGNFEKGRWDDPKRFAWRPQEGSGQNGVWSGLGGLKIRDLPLYNADLIADQEERDRPVYFVEGERCVQELMDAGQLAVSLPGGAAQRDFGTALDLLEGRAVVLWPDKDKPGTDLMDALAEALLGRASAVLRVTPPDGLAAGGDVVDYFAAGRDLADIKPEPVFREPEITETVDGYEILVPLPDGTAQFVASDVTSRSRRLECYLETSLQLPGTSREVYGAHLVPDSNSSRDQYRRQLDKHFDLDLARPLTRACIALRAAIREAVPAIDLDLVLPRQAGRHLIAPILPEGQPTLLFGDGAVGKTFLALDFAVCVAYGVPFRPSDIVPVKGRVLIVDFETDAQTVRMRLDRLLAGRELDWEPGRVIHWPGGGLPLPQQIVAIERFVRERGITFVIVDSAAAACGGDLNDAADTSAYFNALARLGVTTLTLAHTRKSDAGTTHDKAIGSTFWHNAPRASWYAKRADGNDPARLQIGLFCRKMSDGRPELPFGLALGFSDPDGPVTVQTDDLPAQMEPELPLGERLLRELRRADEPLSAPEMAKLVDQNPNQVRARLHDLANAGKVRKRSDNKWEAAA